MPFSSGRSVRAPASKATRIVVARVPSSATRWIGSPLGATCELICGIRADDSARVVPPLYNAAARRTRSVGAPGAASSMRADGGWGHTCSESTGASTMPLSDADAAGGIDEGAVLPGGENRGAGGPAWAPAHVPTPAAPRSLCGGRPASPPREAADRVDRIEGYDPVAEHGDRELARDGHRGW